jgi:hypothetical protein
MIARLAVTAIMLLLAFSAFLSPSGCDNCQQHLGAPFAIFFVVIAAVAWFKWEVIREGFHAARSESQLPIIRLGWMGICGLARLVRLGPDQRRSPSSN